MMEHLLDVRDTESFLREREILKAQKLLSKCDSSNTSTNDNDNLDKLTKPRFRWLGFEPTNTQHHTIRSNVDEGVAEAFKITMRLLDGIQQSSSTLEFLKMRMLPSQILA